MDNTINNTGQIVIYQTQDGQTSIDVKMEGETVWLTQQQMAELFEKDKSVISRHIKSVFAEGELEESLAVAKNATTRKYGRVSGFTQEKTTYFYNLDVIISVGYRVKSKRGVEFRKWANRVLKDYLLKGYAINNQLAAQKYEELSQLVDILGRTIQHQPEINGQESKELISVVTDYNYALDTLDRYDYQQLQVAGTTPTEKFHATYDNAMAAILLLKEKFGESRWFGNEKDDSFKSSIGQIYQTFGGQDLYPSVEEKAAMLLYLVTKNHSFSDGNKRIAATLFLWFLQNNGILYRPDGSKRISDGTLVATTLMIAESRTEEKDVMVKVVVNLINKNNI